MGKKLLSKNIAHSINNWFCNKSQLHNQNSNNEKWNRLSQEETLSSDHNTSVKVTTLPQVIKMTGTVEESMKSIVILKTIINDVIDDVNDDSVGFAHCISADFENIKHVSRGVATIFKKKFGKPFTLRWL